MAKTIATALGVGFLLAGLLGFVAPGFLGAHLSLAHTVVHLVTGAVSLYLGLKGSLSAARLFCLAFGAVYTLLGIVGFVAGHPGPVTEGIPGASPDPNLMKVLPGALELGQMDHIIHVVLGLAYVAGGVLTKPEK